MMPVKKVGKIWMNGKLVKWDEAQIHVLSHVVHYGSSWFEGIRCYETAKGSAVFRLESHIHRLFNSTRIYKVEIPFTEAAIQEASLETIRANKMKACYIRPLVYRGYGEVGVNPIRCPVEVAIAVWDWGTYLGSDALTKGIDVCISTWNRPAPNTLPAMAKTSANYALSQLMKQEAIEGGFAEAIALDVSGNISEGSGENVFAVMDGVIYTPPISCSLLPGITRASTIQLAEEMGFKVCETQMPREMVYVADELFFTGTAAEITPIRSVDRVKVADGKPGPVTMKLQKVFFDIIKKGQDTHHWLKFVYSD
jgi:branched-chain amino acid aminotransferase